MAPDTLQKALFPPQTRDGFPVLRGKNITPGGPDTYPTYGRTWATVSNTPFREYKHWTEEGGISTPLIIHWPAAIDPALRGTLNRTPGHLIDVMATCVDVSSAAYPAAVKDEKIKPMEGTSLRPAFSNQTIPRPSPLFWEHEGNRAVRNGAWKLVAKEDQPWELYNIDRDRSEQHNLAAAQPDRLRAMAAQWDAYAARADVLPLGAWRDSKAKPKTSSTGGTLRPFTLKSGDQLDRSESPAIANRAFTLQADFTTPENPTGVILAHGGSALGYALHADNSQLHFTLRVKRPPAILTVPLVTPGPHTARVTVAADGRLRLKLDDTPETTLSGPGLLPAMPADGLDVGQDTGGLVGAYPKENKFNGTVLQIRINPANETP